MPAMYLWCQPRTYNAERVDEARDAEIREGQVDDEDVTHRHQGLKVKQGRLSASRPHPIHAVIEWSRNQYVFVPPWQL